MSTQEILSSIGRVSRLVATRSLLDPRSSAKNCSLFEGVYEERGHVPPHYHDCEEVLLCTAGEGIVFIGEEPHPFAVGATMVIPPGVAHCIYNTGIGRLRLMAFISSANPAFTWVTSLRRTLEIAEPSLAVA